MTQLFYSRLWVLLHQKKIELKSFRKCIVNSTNECSVTCPLCKIQQIDEDNFNLLCAKFYPMELVSGPLSLSRLEKENPDEADYALPS